jgi:hypothetical protein
MRNIIRTRKRRILAASGTLALCASLAFAAWLVDSNGEGAATFGSLVAPTIRADESVWGQPGQCVPGASCDLHTFIDNPNHRDVMLTAVTANGPILMGPGCSSSSLTVADLSGLSLTVPADTNDYALTIPNALDISPDAENACQGQAIRAPLTGTFAPATP